MARLNKDLVTLLAVVDGTDAAPTPQAAVSATELEASLAGLLKRWEDLKGEAAAVDQKLRKEGLEPILSN